MANAQHRHRQQLAAREQPELHPGTRRHQPQRQGGRADAANGGLCPSRNPKTHQVGHQPCGRGQNQRVAQQLAGKAVLALACHGPDSGHVEQRHTDANQHRNQQQALAACQALGQRQANEGVEAECHLGTGRMVARVDMPSQPG